MSTIVSVLFYIVWRVIADRKAKRRSDNVDIRQQLTDARLKRIEEALTNNPFIPFNK